MFGFSLVGTGMIAATHASALQQISEARLVSVCGHTVEKAKTFSACYGGVPCETIEEALAQPGVDALLVATPSGLHLDAALAAARAGKHLLCEKPLEITTARIDQMIAAHQAAGTRLGCIFQNRYLPALDVIRRALRDRRLGTVTYGAVFVPWWRENDYYQSSSWHGTKKLDGGGALMNQSIHMIDLLCDLMPPVEDIAGFSSSAGHPFIETEDAAVAAVRFQGGALGLIHGTTSVWPGRPKRLEVAGTGGTIILEDEFLTEYSFREMTPEDDEIRRQFSRPPDTIAIGAGHPKLNTSDLHAVCIRDFIHAVQTNTPFRSDGPSARKSVALIERLMGC